MHTISISDHAGTFGSHPIVSRLALNTRVGRSLRALDCVCICLFERRLRLDTRFFPFHSLHRWRGLHGRTRRRSTARVLNILFHVVVMFPSPLLFLGSRHRRHRRPSSFVLAFQLVLRFVRRVSCTHRVPGQQRPPRIGTHERLHLPTGTAPRRWSCAVPVRGSPPRAACGGGKGVPRTRPSSPG